MLDGFKKFIARGNMVDMAVGVVMGAAVTGIVNALVDSIINPLIAAIFGKPDLSKTWNWTITNWAGENSVISFGSCSTRCSTSSSSRSPFISASSCRLTNCAT